MSDADHIFISYVWEDGEMVEKLAGALESQGGHVWLDRNSIDPGRQWEDAVRIAIEQGNFFLACFSRNSSSKPRSFMHRELLVAAEELMKRPYDTVWFLPVKLGQCDIPEIPIGAGRNLRNLQWVDLSADWEAGIERLAEATLARQKKIARAARTIGERGRRAVS